MIVTDCVWLLWLVLAIAMAFRSDFNQALSMLWYGGSDMSAYTVLLLMKFWLLESNDSVLTDEYSSMSRRFSLLP